jgi:predicted metal-dependent peptidase
MNQLTQASVKIQKARIALLLDHPFFGSLLFRLRERERRSIKTMATDGVSLFFNPEYVTAISQAELKGSLAHEVMHPALQHHLNYAQKPSGNPWESCFTTVETRGCELRESIPRSHPNGEECKS